MDDTWIDITTVTDQFRIQLNPWTDQRRVTGVVMDIDFAPVVLPEYVKTNEQIRKYLLDYIL